MGKKILFQENIQKQLIGLYFNAGSKIISLLQIRGDFMAYKYFLCTLYSISFYSGIRLSILLNFEWKQCSFPLLSTPPKCPIKNFWHIKRNRKDYKIKNQETKI